MRLRMRSGKIVEVEDADVCTVLIAERLAEPVKQNVAFKPIPRTTWSVFVSDLTGVVNLKWDCATCKNGGMTNGKNAHKVAHFLHCGVDEPCPPEIAKQYKMLRQNEQPARPQKRQPENALEFSNY